MARTLALLLGLQAVGCRPWLPVRQVDRAIDPRPLSRAGRDDAGPPIAVAVATQPAEGVPLPRLPLRPVSDREALGPPSGTPMLDAALARAQAMEDAVLDALPSVDEPADTPAVAPAPPPAAVESATAGGAVTTPEQPPVAGPPPAPPDPMPGPDPPPADPATEPEAATPEDDEPPVDDEPPTAEEPPADPTVASPEPEPPRPPTLEVADLRLCRKVLGFGRFEPAEDDVCRAGATILLYCEMVDLTYREDGPDPDAPFRSELTSTIQIWPEAGEEPVWSQVLGRAEDVCRHPRRDYYVNYRLTLPDATVLAPGSYRLRLLQTDRLSGQEAMREIPLRIGTGGR